jgi:polar amino acid transport system permease protein
VSLSPNIILSSLPRLAEAAGVTIFVAVASMLVGLLAAIGLMVLEASAGRVVSKLIAIVQSVVFGIPPLVLILCAYYLPPAIGIDLGGYGSGIAALATFSAFFLKEALRGSYASIPSGLIEAARSLGLKGVAIWMRIVVPLMLRSMVPPLINEFTLLVKATALLSAVTVTDVMRTAQQIYAVNYRPIETLLAAALIYAAINLSAAFAGRYLEARFKLVAVR